jgi:hypothetical protein
LSQSGIIRFSQSVIIRLSQSGIIRFLRVVLLDFLRVVLLDFLRVVLLDFLRVAFVAECASAVGSCEVTGTATSARERSERSWALQLAYVKGVRGHGCCT